MFFKQQLARFMNDDADIPDEELGERAPLFGFGYFKRNPKPEDDDFDICCGYRITCCTFIKLGVSLGLTFGGMIWIAAGTSLIAAYDKLDRSDPNLWCTESPQPPLQDCIDARYLQARMAIVLGALFVCAFPAIFGTHAAVNRCTRSLSS